MATLGQEMKNLRSKKQEYRVNAVERNPRTVDPNPMLHILPRKRTYPKFAPQEDTRGGIEAH